MRVEVDEFAVEAFTRDPLLSMEITARAGPSLVEQARGQAPVLTGALRSSIGFTEDPEGGLDLYAIWYDIFLEIPAVQMHQAVRTLGDALDHVSPIL